MAKFKKMGSCCNPYKIFKNYFDLGRPLPEDHESEK
jgi:hypothetical protein